MYNGQFKQCLSVSVDSKTHEMCLYLTNIIKKQCDAWYFCVKYNEYKSARKGSVLKRNIMIYQTAYAGDILIFKEAIRRVSFHLSMTYKDSVKFEDIGTEPENDLRTATE